MKAERAMSKRNFMKVTGFSHQNAQKLWSDQSFPLVAGKVFWSDFVAWRRRGFQSPNLRMPPNPGPDVDHKADAPVRKNDSPNALPPRAARLRASFA